MKWKYHPLPLWLTVGLLTSLFIALLEIIYVITVFQKTDLVFWAFPLHAIVLFPVMLIISFFTSPEFLVSDLIPSTTGFFLIALCWFVIGLVLGFIIDSMRPKYYPPHMAVKQ